MANSNPPNHSSIRVGAIGLDSSHTLQFSRRMYNLHARGQTNCLVTTCWDTEANVLAHTEAAASLRELGIRFISTLDELLSSVDAVMVLTVDGHRHFDLAMNALTRRLPAFIDKPLTCSAAEAGSLLQFTQSHGARCYSASALRFIDRAPDEAINALGRLVSIEASGPLQETAQMSGLWYYACHTFELVDSLWSRGGGVRRIRARLVDSGHHIDLEYNDGRSAIIGLDRDGKSPFVARLRGEKSTVEFEADLTSSYDRLVASICRFFEGADPAVPLENIVETVAAIECAHRSLAEGGAWFGPSNPVFSAPPKSRVSRRKKSI